MPDLSLAARARGALLGHAAGAGLAAPSASARAPVAFTLLLAEELLEPELDFRRLAGRWIEWMRRDGQGTGTWTRTALEHIAAHDSPPSSTGGQGGSGPLARCLPVALATFRSPANLVSGTYHTVFLTHPDEGCAWGAVALNVAAARFLGGKRDFVPDVIEALLNNHAPDDLLAAVRRVPLEPREDLPLRVTGANAAIRAMEIALWFAYHEPNLERGTGWLARAGEDAEHHAAIVGGLMGARDGEMAVPVEWVANVTEAGRIARAAEQLVGLQ